jgi:hypothetical protein
MNRHTLTYIDLHPEPVKTEREPSGFVILLGGAACALTVWGVVFLAFSL